MRQRRQRLSQAACCLLCLVLATQEAEPGEDIGGWLTGPLLRMADAGTVLFVLALILTLVRPRLAAAIALAGCALSTPSWLYLTTPGFFDWIFRGEHLGHPGLMWGMPQVVRLFALAATTYVGIRGVGDEGSIRKSV